MTWKDFQIMVLAEDRKEIREWRRQRLVAHILYCANTFDKVKKTAEQFLPLPGDQSRKVKPPSTEEILKTFEIFGINKKSTFIVN